MKSQFDLLSFRKVFHACIVLCLLVAGYSLIRYPGILYPLRVGLVFLVAFLVILMIYLFLGWRLTRDLSPETIWSAKAGSMWGIVIASFWLIEILTGNLADPQQRVIQIFYFGSSVIAFTLPLYAGILGTRQFGTFNTGFTTSLWSGLVSGILTFLLLIGVAFLFLKTSLNDPQNLLQFQQSGAPNLVTFVIGDYLAGAVGHLAIGVVFGAGLGSMGGVIGKAFAKRPLENQR